MRLKPADEHNQQVLTSLILSCCRWKHPPSLSLSQEGGALSFTCLTLNAALRGCEQAAWCQLTLKSPLSMMSMILYCWLMSFSSTRFFRAFSWSFRLVSNRRLSGARRSGGHTLSLHMGIDHTHSHTHTLGSRRIQISRLESCLALCDSGSALMKAAAAASATNTVQALCMVSRGQQRGTLQKHRRQVVSVLCVTLLTSLTWWQVISR